MNLIFHILLGVFLTLVFFSRPTILIYLIMIFASTITDLDHIKFINKALKTKRFGVQSRSRFHELYGLVIGLFILFLFSFLTEIIVPLLMAFTFHYASDYLTRPTRPFYPFKKEICHFNLYPKSLKGIVFFDTIITGGLAWLIFLIM